MEAALEAGLDVDGFAGGLSFFFVSQNNLLEEVAKFRAARRMWARIMRERFHAREPRSWMLRFHAQTAGSSLTAQQPKNNIVRVTLQALAAVLGGAQSIHTNSMDEALALPTQETARIALRTQQVIADESGVTNTVDPLAGSHQIERMTNELEDSAQGYIDHIDSLGGAVAAIHAGYPQQEIENAAYNYQKAIENGEWGKVITMSSKRVSRYPKRIKDVGVVFDLAIHDLDILRYLSGSVVVSISAMGGKIEYLDKEDHVIILLGFKNGIKAHSEASWLTPMKVRQLTLTCSKAYVILDYMSQTIEIYSSEFSKIDESNLYNTKQNVDITKPDLLKREPLELELVNFLETICNYKSTKSSSPLVSGRDGLEAVYLAQEAIKYIKQN